MFYGTGKCIALSQKVRKAVVSFFLKLKKWKKHAVTAIPEQFDVETLPLKDIVKKMI